MTHTDTIELLKECSAGSKMAVSAIDEVIGQIDDNQLRTLLVENKQHHSKLGNEIHSMLAQHCSDGKEPNPMAKGMSWLKTNWMLGMDDSAATVADLITDGCNMGIKSLNRYLNQYESADKGAKDICRQLIRTEEQLELGLRAYL